MERAAHGLEARRLSRRCQRRNPLGRAEWKQGRRHAPLRRAAERNGWDGVAILLFLLLPVPQLSGNRAPAEWTVVDPDVAHAAFAEHQKIVAVDVVDNPALREQVFGGDAGHLAIDQVLEFGATGHAEIIARESPGVRR